MVNRTTAPNNTSGDLRTLRIFVRGVPASTGLAVAAFRRAQARACCALVPCYPRIIAWFAVYPVAGWLTSFILYRFGTVRFCPGSTPRVPPFITWLLLPVLYFPAYKLVLTFTCWFSPPHAPHTARIAPAHIPPTTTPLRNTYPRYPA